MKGLIPTREQEEIIERVLVGNSYRYLASKTEFGWRAPQMIHEIANTINDGGAWQRDFNAPAYLRSLDCYFGMIGVVSDGNKVIGFRQATKRTSNNDISLGSIYVILECGNRHRFERNERHLDGHWYADGVRRRAGSGHVIVCQECRVELEARRRGIIR